MRWPAPLARPLPLLLLLGCPSSPPTCTEATIDTCPNDGSCFVADGSELAPPGVKDTETCWAVVSNASIACLDWEACDGTSQFGASPNDGSCWYFPAGCLPPGWSACEDSSAINLCD